MLWAETFNKWPQWCWGLFSVGLLYIFTYYASLDKTHTLFSEGRAKKQSFFFFPAAKTWAAAEGASNNLWWLHFNPLAAGCLWTILLLAAVFSPVQFQDVPSASAGLCSLSTLAPFTLLKGHCQVAEGADAATEGGTVHSQTATSGLMKYPQVVALFYCSCPCFCCWQMKKFSRSKSWNTLKLMPREIYWGP